MDDFFFFPTGYFSNIKDEFNDNIDINLICFYSDYYHHYTTTLFTIENVRFFIKNDRYFSIVDGIILEKLDIKTIEMVLKKIIINKDFTNWIKISEEKNKEFILKHLDTYKLYKIP